MWGSESAYSRGEPSGLRGLRIAVPKASIRRYLVPDQLLQRATCLIPALQDALLFRGAGPSGSTVKATRLVYVPGTPRPLPRPSGGNGPKLPSDFGFRVYRNNIKQPHAK
jgi:hypothetical protein